VFFIYLELKMKNLYLLCLMSFFLISFSNSLNFKKHDFYINKVFYHSKHKYFITKINFDKINYIEKYYDTLLRRHFLLKNIVLYKQFSH